MKYRWVLFTALVTMAGCRAPVTNTIPPAAQLMHPGPGVDGPGPGVMMLGDAVYGRGMAVPSSQIGFVGPEGMEVAWDVSAPGMFDSDPLIVPGRYNFPQGAIYRLKLTNIPGPNRQGDELYPTIEIGPATPRTDAYLAHNFIPIQFTEEDFDQVLTGNFVTKVIYLPDADYQEPALAGVETLVSTRLDPGVDPIVEADRRGSILAIIRVGNKDLQGTGGVEQVGGFGPGYGNGMPGGYGGDGCDPNAMGAAGGLPPQYLAGVSAPQYGMPITGTPIGLPGPPHVPLGVPAGLQKHVIHNHTKHHIPGPVDSMKIHVKQRPGYHYPKPVDRIHINERAGHNLFHFKSAGHRTVVASPDAGCETATDCEVTDQQ